jgi:type IV fimbrial biogenesis protein FimT
MLLMEEPMHRNNTAEQAFTLLELLTVLALAGVLFALAVPGFQGLIEQHRRWLFAEELASGLRAARAEAINRNRSVIVVPAPGGWAQGWRLILDKTGRGLSDPDNPLLLERQGDWKVGVISTRNLQAQLAFDYLGVPRLPNQGALAGTFHLCEPQGNSHYRVVIARTGRVRVTREGAPTSLCDPSQAS